MKYTIDPLDSDEGETLIEVHGPDGPLMVPMRGPGDRVMGRKMVPIGTGIGRQQLNLLSTDEELLTEQKMDGLRKALREFRTDHIDPNEIEIGGKSPEGPDEEAEARTRIEFLELVAYAVLAVELETGKG